MFFYQAMIFINNNKAWAVNPIFSKNKQFLPKPQI